MKYLTAVRSLDRRGWIMLGLTFLAPLILALLALVFLEFTRAVGFVGACAISVAVAYVAFGRLGLR